MKKKIAIVFCLILLVIGLVSCTNPISQETSVKQYTMDLDVGIQKNTPLSSSEWDITCNAVVKIEYKYAGDTTDNISLMLNAGTFVNNTPIERASFNAGYPAGAKYGKAEINCVTVNGKKTPNVLQGNELKIKLGKKVKNGNKLEIVVDYFIQLPFCNMRYGYNKFTANFTQFYPQVMRVEEYSAIGDSFYSTADNYSVNIKYPSNYKCLAGGNLDNTSTQGEYTLDKYTATGIRDFAFFIGLVGNIATKTQDGLTISYLYCMDKNPQERLDVAMSAIRVFSEKFGDYGKSNFAIVATPFAHGGMEYGDIITVNSQIHDNATYNNVIVHEVAHQWWYGAVGSDQTNHAWQDEGLTEFSVYLYQLAMSNTVELKNNYLWQTKFSYDSYRDKLNKLDIPIDDNMDRPLSDFLNSEEYTFIAYDKAMLMFNCVYETMGEKLFFGAIQDYFKAFKGKRATPQDLFDVFDKHHVGISEIIKVWLNGKVTSCVVTKR